MVLPARIAAITVATVQILTMIAMTVEAGTCITLKEVLDQTVVDRATIIALMVMEDVITALLGLTGATMSPTATCLILAIVIEVEIIPSMTAIPADLLLSKSSHRLSPEETDASAAMQILKGIRIHLLNSNTYVVML
jgi:hypothetical protein